MIFVPIGKLTRMEMTKDLAHARQFRRRDQPLPDRPPQHLRRGVAAELLARAVEPDNVPGPVQDQYERIHRIEHGGEKGPVRIDLPQVRLRLAGGCVFGIHCCFLKS